MRNTNAIYFMYRALSSSQPCLGFFPLLGSDLLDFLLGSVELRADLVERVLGALLEFLPDQIHPLLPPEAFILPLHLRQPAGLVRGVGGLEPPLGMPVHFFGVSVRGQRERVEGVVDAGRVQRGFGFRSAGLVVEVR